MRKMEEISILTKFDSFSDFLQVSLPGTQTQVSTMSSKNDYKQTNKQMDK